MKRCYACGKDKGASEFGKNKAKLSGLSDECKVCKRIKDSESYFRNREKRRESQAVYRVQNIDAIRKIEREYARSDIGRSVNRAAKNRYYKTHSVRINMAVKARNVRDREKYVARYEFGNAVKLGKIIPPTECERCGIEGKVRGHHEDYSKPFVVLWVCIKCHGYLHRKVQND